ncbi:serine/threonine protein kinase [Nissabacter sp. SGAir0207]|uniref:serine/threonine protein kinase n=1 Tax=Nissabacter sp. SGAir0207 TaxID=2126321 RepID=UPI0010CCB374|nr:serine/threonine protein kinase [Nissabacter sp. SGAir0207]QCR37954.1 serine/threonine protein kinase [Nissabacter sp. SGAir0207]
MTTTPAFNFHALTPDLILDALQQTGIYVDSGLTELNSYENRVFQFMDESRKRYVVKFYRPERWNEAQLREEHEFAAELNEGEIPLIAPLAVAGETLHHYQGYFFTLFPSAGGRAYEVDNLDQLEMVGRYLGRIHQVGGERLFTARPTIGLEEYLTQPRQVLESSELIPDGQRRAFLAATDDLIQATAQRWQPEWQSRRLHGDCHPGNILWRDGPCFVDLDDARNGPAVQDLWMLLHGDKAEQRIQLDILLEAYGEFTDFDQRELALIEPLRAMRMVHYLAWVARRWQDPAFPRSFPWMTESHFWERQMLTFREQIIQLQEPPLQLMPMY